MIEIEYVSTSKLKPYDGNPRKMEPSEMLKLRRSLKDFGFVDPIIVRKSDNLVIGGHQRLDAAKEEGIMEVPVVYVEVSDDKAGLMNIALNKISGDWDYSKLGDLFQEIDTGIEDIEQSGFSTEEIEGVMNGLDHASGEEWGDAFDSIPDGDKGDFQTISFTLTNDQAEQVKNAMAGAMGQGPFVDTGNENKNGNAISRVAETYLGKC
jgi:hypothetical protein